MSRIGNKPIELPKGVTLTIQDNLVKVKGPKGELSQQIDKDLILEEKDGTFTIARPTEQKRHKAMHGLYRALVNNMVVGVSEGYKVTLAIVGVGYKASAQGQTLELNLGYSHNIFFALPPEIKVSAETQKGKDPLVTIEGSDKQLVGQIVAKIKSLRPVEPYKGKGIRELGAQIRRKAGKAGAKA